MSKLGVLCVFWCLALSFSSGAPNEAAVKQLNDDNPELEGEQPETLEDEMDNQENIMTQLLGDYDKVKALSEGSDCRCKCVVRPLSRSACQRIAEDSAKAQDFYTVETLTSGSDCKCACIAPPSALNPCEGEFRFKKLQDAGKDDIKLSTIMDLLEGAFYGMDLLKLHSVTTKLLHRVENIEKAVSHNYTEQQVTVTSGAQEQVQTQVRESRTQMRTEKRKRVLGPPLQRDAAAAYSDAEKKHDERLVGTRGPSRPLLKRSQPEAAAEEQEAEEAQMPTQAKAGPNGAVIRGITYYKSNTEEDEDTEEHPVVVEEVVSGDGSVDLLMEDLLLKQKRTASRTNGRKKAEPAPPAAAADEGVTLDAGSAPPTQGHTSTSEHSLNTLRERTVGETREATVPPITTTTAVPQTTAAMATTTTTAHPRATTREMESLASTLLTSKPAGTTMRTSTAQTTKTSTAKPKYKISWTESPTEETTSVEPPKNPGECKDTLASISDPVTHSTYGRQEGAWMKDPKSADNKIYVTNYYYGNNLLEFQDLETFKQGQPSNSYKLPYNWIGTGHVVYKGAFFYNRAFSRDIIKFDLKLRYVAAWTMLHDAAFEEDIPWQWRGHSDIDFAVDESGLWLIYPAVDEEAFHQEVIILSKLNPTDLSIQKETSWRTGLRKNFYGNCFVVCGVLYAVDKYDQARANVSYAFDTHTNTQMIPRLPFTNSFSIQHAGRLQPQGEGAVLMGQWPSGHL
ncbi:hypothetical protein AGOR_G00240000 [Albula goreensis]|uniref:Olfactomedin-like domain-containing protein n=1 Tax=Albula goreensis TaxID=1534307 RepID=A0A8T3CIM3_9TELE|nr:hypothetical protein AGOR_G00240000 [Albula goreensis]